MIILAFERVWRVKIIFFKFIKRECRIKKVRVNFRGQIAPLFFLKVLFYLNIWWIKINCTLAPAPQ